jgi:UDP-GlcNAc:undecaprenyl-phosphate/decaprenyl-phosphate GlcNAc-1-phosphate transferase
MHFLVPYCVVILIASCLAALLTPLIRSLALHIGAVDHPGGRKIHKTPPPRLGGVSVMLAGTLTVINNLVSGDSAVQGGEEETLSEGQQPFLLVA